MAELYRNPLYRQVAQLLRSEITLRMQPGEKLDSEGRLADRFQVSMITVREALRMLASENLVIRRQGKGTFVAERSSGHVEKPVAVLIDRDVSHPRTSYFFLRVAQDVKGFLEDAGKTVRFYTGRLAPDEESQKLTSREFLQDLESDRFSAVVAVFAFPHPNWTGKLKAAGVPMVGIGRLHQYSIDSDPGAFMQMAVRNLHKAGRKRIAFMGWERGQNDPGENANCTFLEAFVEALKEHHLPLPPREWVREDLHPSLNAAGWEEFKELWSSRNEKPDGLVITDDFLFRDAATAILDLGVVIPDTLMIITHANRGSGILYPFPVTRIEVDPRETAETLGGMLLQLMDQKTIPPALHAYRYHLIEPVHEMSPTSVHSLFTN